MESRKIDTSVSNVKHSYTESQEERPNQPSLQLFASAQNSQNALFKQPALPLLAEIDKKNVSHHQLLDGQKKLSFEKECVATLEDSSKDCDSDDSDSSKYSDSDDEVAQTHQMDVLNSLESPKQPSMQLNIPKANGSRIVFNQELNCFQILRREINHNRRGSLSSRNVPSVDNLLLQPDRPLHSGEYLRQVSHEHLVNLQQFRWNRPVVIRLQNDSESDMSDESDNSSLASTQFSCTKATMSPRQLQPQVQKPTNQDVQINLDFNKTKLKKRITSQLDMLKFEVGKSNRPTGQMCSEQDPRETLPLHHCTNAQKQLNKIIGRSLDQVIKPDSSSIQGQSKTVDRGIIDSDDESIGVDAE